MKLLTILNSQHALGVICNYKTKPSLYFKLAKIMNFVQKECEDYEKARVKYIEDNGVINDKGVHEIKDEEGLKKLREAMTELYDSEINLSFQKLKKEEFEGLELEAKLIVPLLWLFEDD